MKRSIVFLAAVLSILLAIPALVEAATEIQNTANLGYKDVSNNDYSGSDQAILNKLSAAKVTIVKKIRNVTRQEAEFSDPTNGISGEVVEYQVVLNNTGEDTARWVVVTDTLPAGVTYKAGTIKVDAGAQTDQFDPADDKANFGKVANTVTVGANKAGNNGNLTEITIPGSGTVTILYQVTIN